MPLHLTGCRESQPNYRSEVRLNLLHEKHSSQYAQKPDLRVSRVLAQAGAGVVKTSEVKRFMARAGATHPQRVGCMMGKVSLSGEKGHCEFRVCEKCLKGSRWEGWARVWSGSSGCDGSPGVCTSANFRTREGYLRS